MMAMMMIMMMIMMIMMIMNWSLNNNRGDDFLWQMAHGWSVMAGGDELVRVSVRDGRSDGVAGWSSVDGLLNDRLEWSMVVVVAVNSVPLVLDESNVGIQNWSVQNLFDEWSLGNDGCVVGLHNSFHWSFDNCRKSWNC